MGNQQGTLEVTEAELGWLGGMIDGEGTVAFSVYYRDNSDAMNTIRVKPQIIISGTEKVLIEKCADIVSRLRVGVHMQVREQRYGANSRTQRGSKYRPLHVLTVAGFKRAIALLDIICPYIVSPKGEKGRMMLRYMRQRLEKTEKHGRWATHDASDLRMMIEIMRFSDANNGKGKGPKYTADIERLLRDIEQSAHLTSHSMRDDVVRTAQETRGEPTRDGSAPHRVFGGVSRLIAQPK